MFHSPFDATHKKGVPYVVKALNASRQSREPPAAFHGRMPNRGFAAVYALGQATPLPT